MKPKFIPNILLITFFFTMLTAQGTWQWTGRVHAELDWYTLQTEHFNIHYHISSSLPSP